ncbi:MAG: gamma-glutamyl-gamma-aminobutyrate hydrolase family protein [Candidatus Omnitrophica bacterium]|nr:gamma-glutamyl-gamma-aminobutyrate hydrolase family protein [Candidatus Omnitrophota bacterium]
MVIQHVPHEGLGTFEPALTRAGCSLVTLHSDDPKAHWPKITDLDGLIVMGGPQGVNEQAKYPYVKKEIALLQDALKAQRPILGVCLGAQLLAAALGAKVTKNPQKEIGWYSLMREPGAEGDALWEPFGQTETVFQWHGDAFALPKGAVRLASSPLCAQQAFRYGTNAYGLQFHVEVTDAMIRTWMRANKQELDGLKGVIDPTTIRQQTPQHIDRLRELSAHIAETFARLVVNARPAPQPNAERRTPNISSEAIAHARRR